MDMDRAGIRRDDVTAQVRAAYWRGTIAAAVVTALVMFLIFYFVSDYCAA
jgi:hypothetical protein